ncbi:hypothetical protein BDN72DRAFT_831262 [Pluteus cervinus]|uniref:Uncharacterized protein n=1 Tax=Pluteus cervinus TaxID=181527 RepID=A0ACD3BCL8_9AGAR|nr:hypothetical protein BDN72DRAFT_831262 [Pluteus cervinus]
MSTSDPSELVESEIIDLVGLNMVSKYDRRQLQENSKEFIDSIVAEEMIKTKIQSVSTRFVEHPPMLYTYGPIMKMYQEDVKDWAVRMVRPICIELLQKRTPGEEVHPALPEEQVGAMLATTKELSTRMDQLYTKYREDTIREEKKHGGGHKVRESLSASYLDELEEGEIPEEPSKRKAVIEGETRKLLQKIELFQSQGHMTASKENVHPDFEEYRQIQWDPKYVLCTAEACVEAVGPYLKDLAKRKVADLLERKKNEGHLRLAAYYHNLDREIQDRLHLTSLPAESFGMPLDQSTEARSVL